MKFLSKPFLAVLMVAVLISTASAVDFSKPSAVASFGGYNKMIADVNALGQAAGQPQMGGLVDMMVKGMLQGQDIFDPSKPWGTIYAQGGEDPKAALSFMPISDLEKLSAVVKAFQMQGEKISDGYYKFTMATPVPGAAANAVFVKQQGAWAFAAPEEALLENLPADPEALLGNLPKDYLIAIQVIPKNGGVKWLEGTFGSMMQAYMMGQQTGQLLASGKSPQEVQELMQNSPAPTMSLAQLGPGGVELQENLDQIDTLTLGVKCDKAGSQLKDLQFDLQVKTLPSSELEKKIGSASQLTSDFAGFYDPAAAIAVNISSEGNAEIIADLKEKVAVFQQHALDELAQQELNEDELKIAKDWIARLTKMIDATVEKGRFDAGFQFKYAPGESTALFGIKVVNGQDCDEMVQQLLQLVAREDGASSDVASDVATVDGIKFHRFGRVANDPIFGENSEGVIGVSNDVIYVGVGKDPVESLKAVIEKSKSLNTEKLPTVRISLDLPQVLQLINDQSPEGQGPIPPQVSAMFAPGKANNVTFQVIPEKGGLMYRFELPSSIVGSAFKAGMGNFMPMPGAGGGGMPMMPMPR